MGETHKLSDQAIGLASELGTKSMWRSNLFWRNSLTVGSGDRARVSTRHQQQDGELSAGEKLASRGAICIAETHFLSDQAIGLSSALGTKSERGSNP